MPINKLIKKVDNIENDVENLQENIGVINVYKEIIRSNRRINTANLITIIILSAFLLILICFVFHSEKEFAEYRENSITKTELIELLKE